MIEFFASHHLILNIIKNKHHLQNIAESKEANPFGHKHLKSLNVFFTEYRKEEYSTTTTTTNTGNGVMKEMDIKTDFKSSQGVKNRNYSIMKN